MLRSFSYVSAIAIKHATAEHPADRIYFAPAVDAWEKETARAFLDRYRVAIQGSLA